MGKLQALTPFIPNSDLNTTVKVLRDLFGSETFRERNVIPEGLIAKIEKKKKAYTSIHFNHILSDKFQIHSSRIQSGQ